MTKWEKGSFYCSTPPQYAGNAGSQWFSNLYWSSEIAEGSDCNCPKSFERNQYGECACPSGMSSDNEDAVCRCLASTPNCTDDQTPSPDPEPEDDANSNTGGSGDDNNSGSGDDNNSGSGGLNPEIWDTDEGVYKWLSHRNQHTHPDEIFLYQKDSANQWRVIAFSDSASWISASDSDGDGLPDSLDPDNLTNGCCSLGGASEHCKVWNPDVTTITVVASGSNSYHCTEKKGSQSNSGSGDDNNSGSGDDNNSGSGEYKKILEGIDSKLNNSNINEKISHVKSDKTNELITESNAKLDDQIKASKEIKSSIDAVEYNTDVLRDDYDEKVNQDSFKTFASNTIERFNNAPIVDAVSDLTFKISNSTCSPLSVVLPFGEFSTDIHCQLYLQVAPILGVVMIFVWSLLGFRIVFSA